jgi:hypothetical protein
VPVLLTERVCVGVTVADHVNEARADPLFVVVPERLCVCVTDVVGLTVPVTLTD